ncbi:MAG: hypothetical protein ACLU7P_10190 [Eggerthella lenta]
MPTSWPAADPRLGIHEPTVESTWLISWGKDEISCGTICRKAETRALNRVNPALSRAGAFLTRIPANLLTKSGSRGVSWGTISAKASTSAMKAAARVQGCGPW